MLRSFFSEEYLVSVAPLPTERSLQHLREGRPIFAYRARGLRLVISDSIFVHSKSPFVMVAGRRKSSV